MNKEELLEKTKNEEELTMRVEEEKAEKTVEETENAKTNIKEQDNSEEKTAQEEIKKDVNKETEENKNNSIQQEVNIEEKKGTFQKVIIKKINKKTLIIAGIVMIIITMFSTVFAIFSKTHNKMIRGISIRKTDISGLTMEEATEKLKEKTEKELEQAAVLKYNEYETSITAEQIKAEYEIDKAINEAYLLGRSGNILVDNYTVLFALIKKKDININFKYDWDALNLVIQDIAKKIPGRVEEATFCIEGENLIITKGKPGLAIKEKELINLILNRLQNNSKEYVEIPVENKNPDGINIEEIYGEVCVEPKDAYYETNPYKIYPHVVGVNFAITLKEAREILNQDLEEYIIPITFTMPAVTVNMIGEEAFPDLLSRFTTKYDASNRNRTKNLELATAKIDGTVLMPGDEFSYNKIVGKRTIEAGYRDAAIFEGGKVVDGLGGGICQISSTLYNAALFANLEIIQRSNHQFVPSYIGAGRDATVVYGAIDFKFKNSRQNPVKIVAKVESGIAEFKIFGIKENPEYIVELETKITGTLSPTTKYEEDATLAPGEEKEIQRGAQGYTSITYKIMKLNGAEISRTIISQDTYNAMAKIIARGPNVPIVEITPAEEEPIVVVETPVVEPPTNTTPEPPAIPELPPETTP